MGLYHDAPYTLEAERAAPEEPLPASGYTEEMAEQLATLEDDYGTDEIVIEVTPAPAGQDTTVTIAWGDRTAGEEYGATVNWGDGVDEVADNIEGGYSESHEYRAVGSYVITVNVYSLGADRGPTIGREFAVAIE